MTYPTHQRRLPGDPWSVERCVFCGEPAHGGAATCDGIAHLACVDAYRAQQGSGLTDAELDDLLVEVGERRGLLLPTTPEAVARSEAIPPTNDGPAWLGDPEHFRRLLRERTPCPRCGKRCAYADEYQTTKGWFAQEDEAGAVHLHDSNRREASFRCEAGHVWSLRSPLTCPACGWERA